MYDNFLMINGKKLPLTEEQVKLLTEDVKPFDRGDAGDYEKILADFSKVVNDGFRAMAEQQEKNPAWTSVKDEQPKVWKNSDGSMVNYFVYTKEFGVDIGTYLAPASTWLCFGFPAEVTHWMPLPESPEEGSDADSNTD